MKRIFVFYILILYVVLTHAEVLRCVPIGDLFYNLDTQNKTAEVTNRSAADRNHNYNFNVGWNISTADIPSSVVYDQVIYNVSSLGSSAFRDCKNLKKVSIPNSITKIGFYVFSRCSDLENITIPSSVDTIEHGAFEYCENLKSAIIGDGVTYIGDQAFYCCKNLNSVSFGRNVKRIGQHAFNHCSSLTSIVIPSTVSEVGYEAFYDCKNLKMIYYPKGFIFPSFTAPYDCDHIAYDKNNPPFQKKYDPSKPPFLTLEKESLFFLDSSNNNRIETGEKCAIHFNIANTGKSSADNCEVRIKLSGTTNGIKVQDIKLPSIAVGETYEVNIPILADVNTQDGKITFYIEIYEPNGWGITPFDLTVETKAYEQPLIQVVDYNVVSNSGKIKKMEPFTLTFNLQNTKYGNAEDVKVTVNLPSNVFVMDGSSEQTFPLIKSGEAKNISLTLAANNNYPTTNIPITIDIKEKYGKFAENKQIDIALNQTASSSITIAAKEEQKQERKEIQLATLTADVDRNIPQTDIQNKNTFVLIIANENYQSVASVPFALNDGKIFRQYCEQTLGIPTKNIHAQANATGNQIKAQINWLRNVVEVFDNPNIIFYYAGHGIPDEASKTAYLLPVDGSGTDVSTGYKLDDLYTTLGNMPASRITVFMDACFSGSKREEGMLASARGVALKAKSGTPQGNMVVFSAAQGNETAYPNKEKQHGLFTYYLLKKLQQTEGDVSLQDLGDYIITNVKQQSVLLNSKLQTPCVTPSASLDASWQNWKLK